MATYDLTQTMPTSLASGDMLNCPYSGSAVSITLPKGTYILQCWGAQGGTATASPKGTGGKGGYSYGQLEITSPTVFYLYSGGAPSSISSGYQSGGFNGGGSTTAAQYGPSCGGGGGSDIRIGTDSLYARVIVAGGGGGGYSENSSTYYGYGGVGGGTSGGIPSTYGSSSSRNSNYATQTTGNSFGTGADGSSSGAGGGGWYGGYAGSSWCSGNGGSGYVYTSDTASNYPSGCLLNSSYYLSSAVTASGNTSFCDYDPDSTTGGASVTGRSGNGVCKITVVECSTVKLFANTKPNGMSKDLTELDWANGGIYWSPNSISNVVSDEDWYIQFYADNDDITYWSTNSPDTLASTGSTSSNHYYWVFAYLGYIYFSDSVTYSEAIKLGSISNVGYYMVQLSGNVISALYKSTKSGTYNTMVGSATITRSTTDFDTPLYVGYLRDKPGTGYQSQHVNVRQFETTKHGKFYPCLGDYNGTESVGTWNSINGFNTTLSSSLCTYEVQKLWHEVLSLHYKIKQVNPSERYSLPSSYTQLEYIQGTGEQYIDTGFQPTSDTVMWLRANFDTCENVVWGALHTTNGSYSYGLVHTNEQVNNTYTFEYGTQTANTTQYPIIPLDFSLIGGYNNLSGYRVSCTNVPDSSPKLSTSITSESFTIGYNLYLNAMNNSGTVSGMGKAKYYRCLIIESYSVKRYFIPVLENNTGNVGMYDLVNSTFYKSATGTNFIAGLPWYSIQEMNIKKSNNWQQIALDGSSTYFDWETASWEDIYNMCKAVQDGTKTFADYGYDLTSTSGFNSQSSKWGLGSCKKVTLSSTVLGTTEVEMMVICVDTDGSYDGKGTITFQAKNALYNNCAFASDTSYGWNNSILRTNCINFYNYCDAKSYIKTLNKYTCNTYNSGSATTSSETVWVASLEELGIYTSEAPCIHYSGNYEYTVGCSKPYPYYAATLNNSQTYHIPIRNIKTWGDASRIVCRIFWTRTRYYNDSSQDFLYDSIGGCSTASYTFSSGGFVPCFTIG